MSAIMQTTLGEVLAILSLSHGTQKRACSCHVVYGFLRQHITAVMCAPSPLLIPSNQTQNNKLPELLFAVLLFSCFLIVSPAKEVSVPLVGP